MTLLKAECPTCGTVMLSVGELSCAIHAHREEALCQFECPICALTVTQKLPPLEVAMLGEMGAKDLKGSVPFELIEDHPGPPLTMDDLLDFHEAITQSSQS